MAAVIPSKPPVPVTTVYLNDVIVNWDAPAEDPFTSFGASIDGYLIEIQGKDGLWYEDTTNCDGSDPSVAIATTCTFTMIIMQAAPFSLDLADSVLARVTAYNIIGSSELSDSGNGAVIAITISPDAPVNLLRDDSQTSPTQVGLTWEDGAYNGG